MEDETIFLEESTKVQEYGNTRRQKGRQDRRKRGGQRGRCDSHVWSVSSWEMEVAFQFREEKGREWREMPGRPGEGSLRFHFLFSYDTIGICLIHGTAVQQRRLKQQKRHCRNPNIQRDKPRAKVGREQRSSKRQSVNGKDSTAQLDGWR